MARQADERTRILYLAPWVDYGGSDKGTIDWFRCLDRGSFSASLVTTQPSANRRLSEVAPYARELWSLPDLMTGQQMPAFIYDFIATRGIDVVHVMNSRLGFELLADLAALPRRPKVVVQLHVEEPDRSGYVRLVTRRYGNLVDAFSVSSRHLGDAVQGYDVPAGKVRVIPTGVDARGEFSPELVKPVTSFDDGGFHVLYPGRIVEQKDPLLMADVARRVRDERSDVTFHVVGEGALEPELRRRVAEVGVQDSVEFHPPSRALSGWYAACDALLMTSVFEGVPYVAYEAMAMGRPVVAPALAGNAELLSDGGGLLIDPRDDAAAYARAIAGLAADRAHAARVGARGRERALGELSLEAMARAHEELYDELSPRPHERPGESVTTPPLPAARFTRPSGDTPLVSIVIPCFNDGRYLRESLASVRSQSHPSIETIVVDDASTDHATLELLAEIEATGDVRVLRMPRNAGPSAARNAAIAVAGGRYVLPLDADNILLRDAVERLVGQLSEAGDDVGFVYPNLQYFGNRRDYFQAPAYNLQTLLESNFCDTCSLFDADIFRQGVRFAEDITLGHEDWDLALQLAQRGIPGEPARAPTVLYRKNGFTRSDTVEYAAGEFAGEVRERHPELFGPEESRGVWGWHSGPAAAIKARWSPGLSVIALDAVEADGDGGRLLAERVRAQTCRDFELLARWDAAWPSAPDLPPVRKLPLDPEADVLDALAAGIELARAPRLLITDGTAADVLSDPGLVEKLLRMLAGRPGLRGIVLCDAGDDGVYPLRVLGRREAPEATPHSLLLNLGPLTQPLATGLPAGGAHPVASLVRSLVRRLDEGDPLQWRHLGSQSVLHGSPNRRQSLRFGPVGTATPAALEERRARFERPAAIPSLPARHVRRWALSEAWMPPETFPLVRHRRAGSDARVHTNDRTPPPGHVIEYDLGAIKRFQPPGTAELRSGGPEGFHAIPDADEGEPRLREPRHPDCLGFLEEAALPLLDAVEVGYHRPSGQWLLTAGREDPLGPALERRRTLGFIEPYPIRPRATGFEDRPFGFHRLSRVVDTRARRHAYVVAALEDAPGLDLGVVHDEPGDDSLALWLQDGRAWTESHPLPAVAGASPAASLRWAAAPLAWRGFAPLAPRARASARRLVDAARADVRAAGGRPAAASGPGAYLYSCEAPGRAPLYRAVHPVTGDHLMTPWPLEALDMGYGDVVRLGWVLAGLPDSGVGAAASADVPWASRFGRRARRW